MQTDLDKEEKEDIDKGNDKPEQNIPQIPKELEAFAKAIVGIGKRVDDIESVLKELIPMVNKLRPVIEQLENGQSSGEQSSVRDEEGAGLLKEILSLAQGAMKPKEQATDFQQFIMQMGFNYLKASTELLNSITRGAVSKQLGVNVADSLRDGEMQ